MKKKNENVSAMLARLATGVGGISQEQSKLNDGYEQLAGLFAGWLVAGCSLTASGDPEDIELLDALTSGEEDRIERIKAALLANGGTAVAGILRGVFGLHPESKLDSDQT